MNNKITKDRIDSSGSSESHADDSTEIVSVDKSDERKERKKKFYRVSGS